ncbi:MAG: hypothetical protein J5802_05660 [Butyrivibrio sp.]|nr:hypothetical protein [Butyrivibrio sp.]
MHKRGISAIVSTMLITALTIAECFCFSIPSHAENAAEESIDDTKIDEDILRIDILPKVEDMPEPVVLPELAPPVKDLIEIPLDVPSDDPSNGSTSDNTEEEDDDREKVDEETATMYSVSFRLHMSYEENEDSANSGSTGDLYFDEIIIDDATDSTEERTAGYEDRDDSKLEGDEFTVKNNVSDSMSALPGIKEIATVYPSFNPIRQYIVWYYVSSDDSGVYAEGEVKTRSKKIENQDAGVKQDEPKPVTFTPDVTIDIQATCDTSKFIDNGEVQTLGGFSITVNDNNPIVNVITSFFYDAFGKFIEMKEVHAGENGQGTFFDHNGVHYWVNIDAAYVRTNTLDNLRIPFIFDNKEIEPKDIKVSVIDDNGNIISSVNNLVINNEPQLFAPTNKRVVKRDITLEAGSTVQNYDGETITNDDIKVIKGSLLEGHELVDVVINGSQSSIGSSSNEITSYRIVDEEGNDVTDYYNVKCVKGKLILVDGNNGNPPTTVSEELKKDKKDILEDKKALKKYGAANTVLGDNRVARISKTSDTTFIGLRLMIILIAATIGTYLLKTNKTEF